jgi:hypothetical protein
MAKRCIERCPHILAAGKQAWFWLATGTIDNVVPPTIIVGGVGRNLRAADRLGRFFSPTIGILEGVEIPPYDGEAIDKILDLCDRSYDCPGPAEGRIEKLREFSRTRRLFGKEHTELVDGVVCPIDEGR